MAEVTQQQVVDYIKGISVLELSQLVKALESELGVSAAAAMPMAMPGMAMPGAGGTYLYLRETFRATRFGGILPFLFIWQFILSGPLEIASGYIGFAQYVGYFWRDIGWLGTRLVCAAVGGAVVLAAVLLQARAEPPDAVL